MTQIYRVEGWKVGDDNQIFLSEAAALSHSACIQLGELLLDQCTVGYDRDLDWGQLSALRKDLIRLLSEWQGEVV